MRILHVVPSIAMRTGGPAVAVVQSARALQRAGVAVTVFATDMGAPASAAEHSAVSGAGLPEGANEIDLRLFPAMQPRRLAFSPSLYAALGREASRYDVVHIHSLYLFPQFAAYRQARRAGVPYIVSPRGALDPHLRTRSRGAKVIASAAWQAAMLEGASALHLTSDEERRQVAGFAARVRREVVPNGVDCAGFETPGNAPTFRYRYLKGASDPAVLFLGRLSHKKGLDVLVRAFAIVARSTPDALLAIAGPDDEGMAPALRALARGEGIGDRVVFTGMLTGDEKRAALAAADVFALPSRGENFGNALVEAMAAGRACVISPGVNIADAITAAHAGIVVEATPAAFAAAIFELLRDRDEARALGVRARLFARRYDWRTVAPQMIAMYERALAPEAIAA